MNKNILTFIQQNKICILIYCIIILIILPVESIGYSHFITDIISSINNTKLNKKVIYKSIIYIIIIYIITKLLHISKYYTEIYIEGNLNYYIRTGIFRDIINKSKYNYEQLEKGKIISYFDIIPVLYSETISALFANIAPEILAIIVLTCFYIYVDINLGLIIICMLIILIITIYYLSKKCILYEEERQKQYYKNNENIQDKLTNIYSILTSNKLKNEINKNEKEEEKYKKSKFKSEYKSLNTDTFITIIITIFTCIILFYFVKLFTIKKDKKLIITGFLVYFYLQQYINSIKWRIIDYMNNMALIAQYENTLKIKNEIQDGNKINFITKGNIEFKNVCFSYNKKKILNNFNCIFKTNSVNVVLGPSGSGKSTLFKLLLRLVNMQSGNILIDNTNIKYTNIDYIRDNIGVLNQNVTLFNDTIYNNIVYNNPSITQEKINELINKLELNKTIFANIPINTHVGVDGANLSNGQRQIILILREYLNNNKIYLMDEPTSALDKDTKHIILNILKNLSYNKTIIIITHDIEVSNIADVIIHIKNTQ